MASALDHRTVVNLAVVMALPLPRMRGDLRPIRRGAMMMMICTFELLRESEREREGKVGEGKEREYTARNVCHVRVSMCHTHTRPLCIGVDVVCFDDTYMCIHMSR